MPRFPHLPAPVLFVLALVTSAFAQAPPPLVIPLWEKGAPGFENRKDEPERAESYWVKNVHQPTLTVFLPAKEKATGAAMVICPGGGHKELGFKGEGLAPAEYYANLGIACFALKYRLGREDGSPYKPDIHALADGQRAMRLVRSRAGEWGLNPRKIGLMGFSAGGEVVSMVAYQPHAGDPAAADPIDRADCRPDFQILIYPGGLGIPETLPADSPPAFLLVANDDRGAARVVASLFQKMRDAKVPVECHVLAQGGHAFNMGTRSKLASIKGWPLRLGDWLTDNILAPSGS